MLLAHTELGAGEREGEKQKDAKHVIPGWITGSEPLTVVPG